MDERQSDSKSTERYETVDPHNPPRSVMPTDTRKAGAAGVVGMWYYLGPIALIAIVIGVAVFFWARDAAPPEDAVSAIGTVGDDERTPGGGDPGRRPDSTRDEVERRGGDLGAPADAAGAAGTVTNLSALFAQDARSMSGRRVAVQNVAVVDARDAKQFWIQDGDAKVAVVAPSNSPELRAGMHVSVSGTVEADGQGVRIRATEVTKQ